MVMERVVLSVLLVSGLSKVMLCTTHEYHFVNESKTWTEAQTHCRKTYTDLATIDDMEDMSRIKNIIKDRTKHVWIGLYRTDISLWKWSLEDRSLHSPEEYAFRNWYSGQPEGGNEKCAVISDGQWHDWPCTAELAFWCYDGRPNTTEKYKLITQKMSWRLAQRYCRENHTDLASVANLEENQHLYENSKNQTAWIGLFRDSWTWSDGANSSLRFWYPTEPNNSGGNQDCVVIRQWDDWWGDIQCAGRNHFLCYKELVQSKSTMKVTMTFEPSIDMECPIVQAAILLQIRKQLQERGLPADTKVTWKKQIDGKVFHKETREEERKRDEP